MLKCISISLLLLAFQCAAQNYAVVLWGSQPTNAPERLAGIPTNWPVGALTMSIGTNTQVDPPAILMSKAQFQNCIATNQLEFRTYESNLTYLAQSARDDRIANLKVIYNKIPAAITISQGYSDAWEAGTNFNAAQLQVWAQKNNEATLGILKLLDKLGPFLMDLYRPD